MLRRKLFSVNFQIVIGLSLLVLFFGTGCGRSDVVSDDEATGTDPSIGVPDKNPDTDKIGATSQPADKNGSVEPGPQCLAAQNLDPLSMPDGFCLVARLPLASAVATVNFNEKFLYTYEVSQLPFIGSVNRSRVDWSHQRVLDETRLLNLFANTTATIFPGQYLAVLGRAVAAGYTEDQTFAGNIYFTSDGGQTVKQVQSAKGNFDAVFIDEQTLLINGLGAEGAQEGQGVYMVRPGQAAWRVIKNIGEYSGNLVLTSKLLIAGGFAQNKNSLYAFSLTKLMEAINKHQPLNGKNAATVMYSGPILDATAFEDTLLVATMDETTYQWTGLSMIEATLSGNEVSAKSPRAILSVPSASQTELTSHFKGVVGSEKLLGLHLGGQNGQLQVLRRK